jgi:Fe2+ transport system protein FeoA
MRADVNTLVETRRGMQGTILSLPENSELRSQCIRLGLAVGANFTCIERLPGGTIVLQTNRQEIALGRSLAIQIGVAIG